MYPFSRLEPPLANQVTTQGNTVVADHPLIPETLLANGNIVGRVESFAAIDEQAAELAVRFCDDIEQFGSQAGRSAFDPAGL